MAVVKVALADAASVSVEPAALEPGLNVAVTPAGMPAAVKITVPAKPFEGTTVIVLVPLVPCFTVSVLGAAESVKSGIAAGLTVRTMVTV